MEHDQVVSPEDVRGDAERRRGKELASHYKALGTVFTTFDSVIPETGIETFSPRRVPKEREFYHRPSRVKNLLRRSGLHLSEKYKIHDSVAHVRTVLSSSFSDAEQSQILAATNDFLTRLASNMEWGVADTVPYGRLDSFLAGFPENMMERLGDQATAETITRILRLGSHATEHYVIEVDGYDDQLHLQQLNNNLGLITRLVGETIPEVLINVGEEQESLFTQLENNVATFSAYDLDRFVRYKLQPKKELTPEDLERIDKLELSIGRIDPEIDRDTCPFNQDDPEPWKENPLVGREEREATYGDLGAMVRRTEKDNREYGIVISKDTQGLPIVHCLRGTEESIKNHAGQNRYPENIFFHAHPSNTDRREPVAPLVSRGDLLAMAMNDAGGGYLNVACVNGVTLYVGEVMDERTQRTGRGSIYTIESGDMKGQKISPAEEGRTDIEIMTQINALGEPYVYSVDDVAVNRKNFFIHVPWQHLDGSIKLSDLCFGDGLVRMLAGFSDLPAELPQVSNLHKALYARAA